MQVRIYKELFKAVGKSFFESYNIYETRYGYSSFDSLDLEHISKEKVLKLAEAVSPHIEIRGTKRLLTDINTWLKMAENGSGDAKPRTAQHFSVMLKKYLMDVPGHRLYQKDGMSQTWFTYYVSDIEYHPAKSRQPPYVTIELLYEEFSHVECETITFHTEDCIGITVTEALSHKNFFIETDELRKQYLEEKAVWEKWVEKIGKQYLAVGTATDDLDGNDNGKKRSWYRSTKTIRLDKDDEPAHVVIDIFQEGDKERYHSKENFNKWFWTGKDVEDLDNEDKEPYIEIPIHPMIACFDLRRHLRIKVHVSQLTEYIYDPKLGEKLVLPEDSQHLVEVLLMHKSGFKDIISSKGGGSVILCAGPPGTGKTLTAEVYAEVTERPLYSVQCSQLGVTAEDLEDSLLKVFARSQRWNAILLLDEADVYVAARGSDIQQNAIVGVFLRTIEYYKGVLFLTTNRGDSVDDAIASRCVAKIEYDIPSLENQKQIWRILAGVMNLTLTEDTIDAVAKKHSNLSGRDIKNLLKLTSLINTTKSPINITQIDFVHKFKPTKHFALQAGITNSRQAHEAQ